jgi:cytolysin (calcineurin-like family phosphatase)
MEVLTISNDWSEYALVYQQPSQRWLQSEGHIHTHYPIERSVYSEDIDILVPIVERQNQ